VVIEPATSSLADFFIPALFVIWLIGAIALAVIQLRKIRRQSKLIKHASAAPTTLANAATDIARRWGLAPIPILIARGIASPFLWCLGRLKLIWPQNMLASEPSPAIIAHELAHLRRRDYWIAWLEMVAALLWWWNPIFWIVRKNLRSTSDALALSAFPEGRCEYAETLLELSAVSKSRAPALVLGVSTGAPSSFERRMSMIVSERVSGKLSLLGILAAGFLALVSLPGWTYGQDRGDDSDARKLAELKVKIAQEHLELLKQKMAQDGAGAKEKSQIEAEHLVAVIHKLALAAHQGDEEAAKKLAAIHAKLQAAFQQAHAAKPGKTFDPASLLMEADEAKLSAATKKGNAEKAGRAADEVARALHAEMEQALSAEKMAKSAQGRLQYEQEKLFAAKRAKELAEVAQQGDEEAAKKLARMKLELNRKREADAAKAGAEADLFERIGKKRAEADKQNADAEREFEWKRAKQGEAAKQNADAEIKAIEADIKKLQMMKRKLEQDAKKNSDPLKP
jgi:beta-lactamase regulating signal transducer with metallopeptidase domain